MPKFNSSLDKFDKEPAGSIERKQFQELVANEFNDARSQVIKRLFEQSAVYNELFDKQRTLGNTVVAFTLGKELGMFKDSIERAKVKLEENEKRPFNDVLGAYSKVISAINAYINSTGARAGEVAGLVGEIRNLAPAINDLFIEGIRKQNERRDVEGEEKANISDNDLINIYLLFEKIQSGYAEGQTLQGINLAGIVSASEAEKERLRDQLRFYKELTLRGIARYGPEIPDRLLPGPPRIVPFPAVYPSRAEEARAQVEAMERDPVYREEVARREAPPAPFVDPVTGDIIGQGKRRGKSRSMNSEMSRSYELIHRWSGFPYFVPPSAPPSKMVNPRSRVDINTEGSGKKKGKKSGKPKYTDI